MTVIQFPGHDDTGQPASGRVRAALERVPDLPDRRRVGASARWWSTVGLRRLLVLAVMAPWLVVRELYPIGVGLGRIVGGWADWCYAADYAARVDAARSAGQVNPKDADRVESRRERRRLLSGVVAVAGGVAVVVAAARWPGWLAVVVAALILVADAVGRRTHRPAELALPPPARAILTEGVPLVQVTRTLVDRAADRWGVQFGIARAMTYSHARREYEVWVTSAEPITAEILRDLERAIGATDHTIRCLAPPDGQASVRRILIRDGDPLAEPVPAPALQIGGTVAEWVPLGVSMTDTEFALPFAGVHHRVVAGTGGGKSKWALRSTIRGLAGRRDVVLGGIDITSGPELVLWRGVIQHRGLDVGSAERVLDLALAEIARRARVLEDIAADDDPDNDVDEWHAGLGPAFVILVDEFAQLAVFDGRSGRVNLLGKCEQIVRTGRKHWVSLVMFSQRTGNDDFGSATMTSQCAVTVAGPCDQPDAVRLFGADMRDQGWTPHLLAPGVEGDIRDAGKVFVSSPGHRSPDIYRYWAPGSTAEVKRLARQLVDAGLPTLDRRPAGGAVDAVEVPTVLAEVEAVFAGAGWPERLSTADLVAELGVDERVLAEQLRPFELRPGARWRPAGGGNPVRGYLLADVRSALGRFE